MRGHHPEIIRVPLYSCKMVDFLQGSFNDKAETGRRKEQLHPFVIIEKSICFFSDINGILIITIFIIVVVVIICSDVKEKGKASLDLSAPEQLSAPQ